MLGIRNIYNDWKREKNKYTVICARKSLLFNNGKRGLKVIIAICLTLPWAAMTGLKIGN